MNQALHKLPLVVRYLLLSNVLACGSANDPIGIGGESSGGSAGAPSQASGGSATYGGAGSTSGTTINAAAGQAAVDTEGVCKIAMDCDSEIVNEPKVLCRLEIRDASGAVAYSDHAGVELRGRSSLKFPKHNYAIELRTAANIDNPASLLGMGKEADWVLDGSWVDRSFMRNRLMFSLFRDVNPSRWAPRVRFCELTLNSRADGIYLLVEKIKRDDDRIDLLDDESGSTFILRQDDDGTLQMPGSVQPFEFVFPKQSAVTAKQEAAAQDWLSGLGNATLNDGWEQVPQYLDLDAAIDWILLEEFSKNIDAYHLSLYFARSQGGLAWVVPWDFDLSFGQPTESDQTNERPEGWCYKRTALLRGLSANPAVLAALGPRWRELRQGPLSNESLERRLNEFAAVLSPDVIARNFSRWPIAEIDFSVVFSPLTTYDVTSYDDEMAHLRTWIIARLEWLDKNVDAYPMY